MNKLVIYFSFFHYLIEEIWSAYTFSFFPAAKPVVKCQGLVITYVEIKYTTVCHQHSCGNEVYAVG